eukprot:6195185-Prymnesium_polylepis.1
MRPPERARARERKLEWHHSTCVTPSSECASRAAPSPSASSSLQPPSSARGDTYAYTCTHT